MHDIDSERYEDLSLQDRCEGMQIARQNARDDHERNWMMVPYQRDDPRYDAYLAERNRLRAAAGKPLLRDPRSEANV